MPAVRRISQARMMAAVRERETVTICPSCSGKGFHIVETATAYRRTQCKWCLGDCMVPATVGVLFRRAKRISGYMAAVS